MIERFLIYSLERKRKICVVLLIDGEMKKTNLQVTSIENEAFTAKLPGRKREIRFLKADVLTAAYARGDRGELE